jgi:macrophage erythroblast attacher
MDEDNMPMAFPDGHVYSREVRNFLFFCTFPRDDFFGLFFLQALEEMAAKNDGIVTCPRTGKSCAFQLLRKVFIS